jgi:hypothetical protein
MQLELLAREPALQKGELTSQETSTLLKQVDSDINSQITPIDTLGLLNSSNMLVNISPDEYRSYIGLDRSQTGYVKEVNKSGQPYISSGFSGALGRYIIAIGIPINNLETRRHVGTIATAPLTSKFFEHNGNNNQRPSFHLLFTVQIKQAKYYAYSSYAANAYQALNVLTDYASSRIQVLSPALAGHKACPNRTDRRDLGWRFSH